MSVKTEPVDSADPLDRLDAVRLDKDWSFRQLSDDMARAGVIVSAQTLHQVLTDRESKPYDRTLHKIRRYLNSLAASAERKSSVRKSSRRVEGAA